MAALPGAASWARVRLRAWVRGPEGLRARGCGLGCARPRAGALPMDAARLGQAQDMLDLMIKHSTPADGSKSFLLRELSRMVASPRGAAISRSPTTTRRSEIAPPRHAAAWPPAVASAKIDLN